MKRLFVALKIQKTPVLSRLFSQLKFDLEKERIKWVDPRGLHLTLAFLGDTPSEKIPELVSRLKGLAEGQSPFSIQLKSLGAFPAMDRPRILWAGVKAPENLFSLQKSMIQTLVPDYPINDRRFAPHLTLGRIKGGVRRPGHVAKVLKTGKSWTDEPLNILRFELMESQLRPDGPRYTVANAFKFKA